MEDSMATGGPTADGTRAARSDPRPALALVPLSCAMAAAAFACLLSWLWKAPCAVPDPFAQFAGRSWVSACYNDTVLLYEGRQLDQGVFPYQPTDGTHRAMEYPVLTGIWMWLVARLSKGVEAIGDGLSGMSSDLAVYFAVGSVLLAAWYLLAVVFTSALCRRRPWDVMIMCASPLLITHALTNWDAIPIALTAGAMLAWARQRPILAGVLMGLGAAAKLYPILLLGPLLVLCLRSGTMPSWFRAAAGAAAAWLAVNLPILVLYPSGWYEFVRLNSTRPPEWDTWYFIVTALTGRNVPAVNQLSLVLFLLACGAIGWFALATRRRPRVAQLAFLVVCAFLLTNKVWSPQYSLWLLPLLVLALPRWVPVLLWQLAEVAVWVLLTPHLGPLNELATSIYPFIAAAIIRDVLLVYLVFLVVRDILRPARDLVRQSGDDDPAGGVLDRSADAWMAPPIGMLFGGRRAQGRSSH